MARTSRSSAGWIAGISIGILGWFVHKLVSLFMPDPKPETGIKAARGTYSGVPGCAEESELAEESISQRYELMCIQEPLKYQGHPMLQKVISDYRKLIKGEIPDPEGKHVPSEWLCDGPNKDYTIYFKAQKKVLGKVDWVDQELKRLHKEVETGKAVMDLYRMAGKYGIPVELQMSVITIKRISTYNAEQWDGLFKAVKGYLADYKRLTVHAIIPFLELVPEYEYASNLESLELFKTYLDSGVYPPIIARIVRGEISSTQAQLAWQLSKLEGVECDFEEALIKVLQSDQQDDILKNIRESYRAEIRRR